MEYFVAEKDWVKTGGICTISGKTFNLANHGNLFVVKNNEDKSGEIVRPATLSEIADYNMLNAVHSATRTNCAHSYAAGLLKAFRNTINFEYKTYRGIGRFFYHSVEGAEATIFNDWASPLDYDDIPVEDLYKILDIVTEIDTKLDCECVEEYYAV